LPLLAISRGPIAERAMRITLALPHFGFFHSPVPEADVLVEQPDKHRFITLAFHIQPDFER
jgi:hypothetical protein